MSSDFLVKKYFLPVLLVKEYEFLDFHKINEYKFNLTYRHATFCS